jgi:hypothetical protein
MSSYLEEELLDHVLKNNAYSSPSSVYVGIAVDNATEAELEGGTLTNEITGYTGDRKTVSFGAISQVSGKATTDNDGDLNFQSMPAVTVKYVIICDAATGGNILYWAEASSIKTTNAGDTYQIPAGEITVDHD